ncbi:MAG TPA: translation initiation factor IF-2 N-terminal domain-containing protein, partial [Acidimicrobiales bacterium]|nr:translation initiation factor IF-2 N-terminal domain-containing protein [Acidimicrobiales bacterium]
MAQRIRVYELGRELGLTNKETLDLCDALGIGVKSHSSSIEDAQADRVRRKADREGLRRDVSPPEPGGKGRGRKAEPAGVSAGPGPVPSDGAAVAADAPAPAPPAPAEPVDVPSVRPADPEHRLITSRPASEQPDLGGPGQAPPARRLPPPPSMPRPAAAVPLPPPAPPPAPAPAPPVAPAASSA